MIPVSKWDEWRRFHTIEPLGDREIFHNVLANKNIISEAPELLYTGVAQYPDGMR